MSARRKIVVTGALGHIGSRLIRELPDKFPHAEILLLDDLSTQRYCSLFELPAAGKFEFIEADILKADLAPYLEGARAVIHLAAITNAAGSFDIAEQVEMVNFKGTERIAHACVEAKAPLMFLSTTSVYGTQSDVVDEGCPVSDLQPQSPYAESKLKSEQLLQKLAAEAGLRHVILRLGTIFGTSIGMRFHTAINKFCWQALTGQPITVWRTALDQKRPYLSLDDCVAAIEFVLQKDLFDGRIYNVLTLNATVREIVELIKHHVANVQIEYVDTRIMNQLSYTVLNDRFQALGFEFHGSLPQGIADTIALLRGIQSR
ncbi:MAG TPA: SDR family oxidoreductase [Pyrinomonadaceae bacterium]|jgi:nucleoside-diphosphate-sugar epimerase|nr:SDR family oxidoreductase [Pyrinomonadaceae bacterium]